MNTHTTDRAYGYLTFPDSGEGTPVLHCTRSGRSWNGYAVPVVTAYCLSTFCHRLGDDMEVIGVGADGSILLHFTPDDETWTLEPVGTMSNGECIYEIDGLVWEWVPASDVDTDTMTYAPNYDN